MAFSATIIFGPTASGKTARAYALAREHNANILSFDSRHVYKGMDIVTGKDLDPDFPGKVYGIDLVSPIEEFSIRHFATYAAPIIQDHQEREQPLVLVGGSWLYAQTLLLPPQTLSAPVDEKLRAELAKNTTPELQAQLQALNPTRWEGMNDSDRANPRRLVRAIEIALNPECGSAEPALLEDYTLEILDPEMNIVEQRILARVEERWENGALEETRDLIKKYSDWSSPAFSSTGYKVLRQFLEGTLSQDEAKHAWYLEERQYAKRQKTWVRSILANRSFSKHFSN